MLLSDMKTRMTLLHPCYYLLQSFYFLRIRAYSFETYVDHVHRSTEFQNVNDNDLGHLLVVVNHK